MATPISPEESYCPPLPAVLQLPTPFIRSIHPVPSRISHIAVEISNLKLHVFIYLAQSYYFPWFSFPLYCIHEVEKIGGYLTSTDENYGFRITLINGFSFNFTMQKTDGRKHFIYILQNLTNPISYLNDELFKYKVSFSKSPPFNFIYFYALYGIEIVLYESELLQEISNPSKLLLKYYFNSKVTPAAVFPYILKYLQENFSSNIFSAENNSNFKLCAYNVDFSLCQQYPMIIAVPKAASIQSLRQATTVRQNGRFPILSYTYKDAPCIFRASGLLSQSDADKLLFDSFATVYAAETIIIDCRPQPIKAVTLNYGTLKGIYYLNFPEVSQVGYIYREFSEAVYEAYLSGYSNLSEYYLRLKDEVLTEELKSQLLNFKNIEEYVKYNYEMPMPIIYYLFYLKEQKICPFAPPNYIKKLGNSGYHQLLILYIYTAMTVAYFFKYNKNVCLIENESCDHTAVISALAYMFLNPKFRTFEGFRALIESEFLRSGHKIGYRIGLYTGEFAPLIYLYLNCIILLLYQNQDKFEYDEEFVIKFAFNIRSKYFGTFLLSSEMERIFSNVEVYTNGIWSIFAEEKFSEGKNIDGQLYFNFEFGIWKEWFNGDKFVEESIQYSKIY